MLHTIFIYMLLLQTQGQNERRRGKKLSGHDRGVTEYTSTFTFPYFKLLIRTWWQKDKISRTTYVLCVAEEKSRKRVSGDRYCNLVKVFERRKDMCTLVFYLLRKSIRLHNYRRPVVQNEKQRDQWGKMWNVLKERTIKNCSVKNGDMRKSLK